MHYILQVSRYTNSIYFEVYLVVTYLERLFSTVCYFLSYFCWSVACMSRVIKFHNCFLTCSEIKTTFIFEGFLYCRLCKVQFQLSSTAQVTFLFTFCWSVNCKS